MQNASLISSAKVKYSKNYINYTKTQEESMCSECDPCRGNAATHQNATPVEETQRKRSNATPVEETLQSAQNATPVEETLHKRSNATSAEETTPRCSKEDSCRRNHASVIRIRTLSHKVIWAVRMRNTAEIASRTYIGFVTTDLYTKYRRKRSGNEHRVCNHWSEPSECEILQKSHRERT